MLGDSRSYRVLQKGSKSHVTIKKHLNISIAGKLPKQTSAEKNWIAHISVIFCNLFPHSKQSSLSKIFVFSKIQNFVFQNVFCISKIQKFLCYFYWGKTENFEVSGSTKPESVPVCFHCFSTGHHTLICLCGKAVLVIQWLCTDPGLDKKRGSDLFRNKHMIQFGPIRIEPRLFLFCWLHQVFTFGMWDLVPWPGIHSGSLHWEYEVLATGPQAKSLARSFYHGC